TCRQTRSGAAFSPWVCNVGVPLHAPNDFELDSRVEAAIELQQVVEDAADAAREEDDLPLTYEVSECTPDMRDTPPTTTVVISTPSPPSPSTAETSVAGSKEKYHSKKRSKERRRAVRSSAHTAGLGSAPITGRPVKAIARKRVAAAQALKISIPSEYDITSTLADDDARTNVTGPEPIKTDFSLDKEDVPIAKSAFVGKRLPPSPEDAYAWTAKELEAQGLCRPILDKTGRVFAILAGHPRDPAWPQVNEELQKIFELSRDAYSASASQLVHRRGQFCAVNCGISYGGGQRRVSNLAHSAPNQATLNSMLRQKAVRRIANFGNSVLRLFAPRMYEYYSSTLSAICNRDLGLWRNFDQSVFSCATFNLGPKTVTHVHTDHLNIPCGWCCITALGNYDPTRGGTSYSFTQFSPGGIFRWVECGFQSLKDSGVTAKELNNGGHERWRRGIELLSTWSEICTLHRSE
ncbi:hypothetical protein C2E23DRAFT_743690, partial [Lenzites betulinus]